MYLEEARRRIAARSFPDAEDIHPCTPDEVEALEQKLGHPLPAALREFLLWCGHGLGDIWRGSRCFEYEELIRGDGLDSARSILAREGHDASLLDDLALVIQFDECDQFTFVRLDEGDDPPVYGRNEGEHVQRHCDHFSELVKLIVDQEFGIEAGPPEDPDRAIAAPGEPDGAPSRRAAGGDRLPFAPGLTAGAQARTGPEAYAERPSIVPPELTPDRRWVEESYGFLPPSLQQGLGELRASFRPSASNLTAAVILGALVLLGGLALVGLGWRELALAEEPWPVFAQQGMSWLMFGLAEAGGLAISVAGALLIRQGFRLSRSRVFVGEGGLCRSRDGRHELLRWEEVCEIEDALGKESMPAAKLLLLRTMPSGSVRQISIRTADGRELRFTPNDLDSFARFEAILRRASAVHELPWKSVRLRI